MSEIEIRKYVSGEFKNRLEMIWEDMFDDNIFGEMFYSKFNLFYDDCVDEGLLDNLKWMKDFDLLIEKIEDYSETNKN